MAEYAVVTITHSKQEVFWLEVAMHHIHGMAVLDHLQGTARHRLSGTRAECDIEAHPTAVDS